VKASSMSELTFGIGYYTRFFCGLAVGWRRGGGSFTKNNTTWPCHWSELLHELTVPRKLPYTFSDNVCTHSYSYVWYDETAWTAHIGW
jgi:hypothetical protein